jgi:hypothetical protein
MNLTQSIINLSSCDTATSPNTGADTGCGPDVRIFCVTHRDYPLLPMAEENNTILVGMNEANIDIKTRDYYPEISKVNILYNEVEAEKYIREHVNSHIKGLYQYSYRPDMSVDDVKNVLQTHKAICNLDNIGNMYQHYCVCHCPKPWETMLDILKEKGLDIDQIIHNGIIYSRHILITTNDLFNDYFDFAWPIIQEVQRRLNLYTIEDAERIVKEKYGPNYPHIQYQTRIIGFLTERLWTIWYLLHYKAEEIYIPKFVQYKKLPLG